MSDNVTPKQGIFIAEYLVDGNGTRAAIAAGVPEKSAHVTAARWLRNAKIARIIAERRAKRAQKLEITADRVLQEIAKLAFYDPRNLYDESGNVKAIHDLDDVTAAAVAGVDVDTVETSKESADGESITRARTITRKFKLADKGQNLERLGKHLKLFTDRVEGDITTAQVKLTEEERAARVAALLRRAAARVEQTATEDAA